MKHIKQSRARVGLLFCLALASLSACAAPQRPAILESATRQLERDETRELESLQPKLLREAREHEHMAKEAFAKGELDEAVLNAHIAVQRYETARNLVERDASRQLTVAMVEADASLEQEEQRVRAEAAELERYAALEQRFERVSQELATDRDAANSLALRARRSLSAARSRQAEAIGAGAPSEAPDDYANGRLLLESALESLDSSLWQESLDTSTRAIEVFERAILTSRDSHTARRREEVGGARGAQPKIAPEPTDRVVDRAPDEPVGRGHDAAKARAISSIDDATTAQSTALAARMDTESPGLYKQATFLLESAERRLEQEDWHEASVKAERARGIFLSGSVVTEDNVSSTSTSATAAIQRAEDARGNAIARGTDTSLFERPDYMLELARTAFGRGEYTRALEKAIEAGAAYDGLASVPSLLEPERASQAQARVSNAPKSSMESAAEERIVTVQMSFAEAVGDGLDKSCAASFGEARQVLELAQQRFDRGDYERAFEFAVRASERLDTCHEPKPTSATPSSSKDSAKEERERALAEGKQRDEAIAAISASQLAMAELSITHQDDLRLLPAAKLIASAEGWYERRDWSQAIASAKLAGAKLDALEKQLKLEAAAPVASEAPPTEIKPPCADISAPKANASAAKLRAATFAKTAEAKARFDRSVGLIVRAEGLHASGVCDAAEVLLEEATTSFEEIISLEEARVALQEKEEELRRDDVPAMVAPKQDTLSREQVEEMMRAERDIQRQRSLAKASVNKALLAKSQLDSLETAHARDGSRVLERAQAHFAAGDYLEAAIEAERAASLFQSRVVSKEKPTVAVSDDVWKPAYAKVIDALIERDRVGAKLSDAEKVTFEGGVQNLERARQAWEKDDYLAAGKFADAAKKAFLKSETDALAREQATERARAAREQQLERDAAEKQRAEQEAKTREEEERAARERVAREEDKARVEAAQKEELERVRREAEDSIRGAQIAADQCEQAACDRRDADAIIRAGANLDAARSAHARGEHERAAALASEAREDYSRAREAKLPFTIPAGISRVSRLGDRLELSPKLSFKAGTSALVVDSQATVDELARVLLENEGLIIGITLAGYTDSRGSKDKNIKLSLARAEAIKQQLTARGVKAGIIVANGFGPENPIADNTTKAGREANRRVEVTIEIAE